MEEYADLEIGLHRRDATSYTVEMRFVHPDSDADIRLSREQTPLASFDKEHLEGLSNSAETYGRALTESLFADSNVKTAFLQAFSTAQSLDVGLRVRLLIGASAPELHTLRWETLRDPQSDDVLLTSEQLFFSRYLSSFDWRPIQLRPRTDLRALVAIANPNDLDSYRPGGTQLAPIDVAGEVARVRAALGDTIALTVLASDSDESAPRITLNTIASTLREGYDIFYLVAHGAIVENQPYIWLENEQGEAEVVSGNDLVVRIKEQQQRPRIIVLASCQSAGTNTAGALAALGPRLAEVGVPAVIAMQGNISMDTVETFMPAFFEELQRDGRVDRAVGVARGLVRERHDWWMPVLFMRLKSGRIWYVPGFGDDGQDFEKWPALIRNIQQGKCTPIIGQNLAGIADPTNSIATTWAEQYHFPLPPHQSEDLHLVAQYLSVNQDFDFPRYELLEHLKEDLFQQYPQVLAEYDHDTELADLFATVGAYCREHNPNDPYNILAAQPFPIYITANISNLLSEALIAAGKDPQIELCRWNEDLETIPSVYEDEPDYQPTVERPLVYHIFGHVQEPDSFVLTEDDYFDYLMGIAANRDLIPIVVREALTDTGLLFLGFQLDQWSFRVLYRSMVGHGMQRRRKRYAHVAGQVSPDEGRILEPARARKYLQAYFDEADIDIFWGSVPDFIQQLTTHMKDDSGKDSGKERGRRRRLR